MPHRSVPVLHHRTRGLLIGCGALVTVACASPEGPAAPTGNLSCVTVSGSGTTEGDRHVLAGDGTFRFGNVERPGQVGLYLFDMTPAEDNGFDVLTQYQFHWDDGDSFLSRDVVYFEPTLEPDTYRFGVQMSIVAGSGIFADLVGEDPLRLTAELKFGPPARPGDANSAFETFEVGGTVCY